MTAIVDRIEDNNIAVLEINGGEKFLNVPLSELPEGTSQGDILTGEEGNWQRDTEATNKRTLEILSLFNKLFKKV